MRPPFAKEVTVPFGVLCIINSIVAFGFGLAFIVAPGATMGMYGPQLTPGGLLLAQLLGAAFISFGVLTFLARGSKDAASLAAITLAIAIGDAIGGVLCIIGTVGGAVNALGWSSVAIYLFLAAGFAYFRFVKQPA